jgi:hypothetical protein
MADMGKASDGRKKRRSGDVAEAIKVYMEQNPDAQYFDLLDDLHARGYRVNRHGNIGLMDLWLTAREEARR